MACFHPLEAYQSKAGTPLIFRRPRAREDLRRINLPCGRCIGCRLEYSRQWAVRCMHEASLYEFSGGNSFVTLTYDEDHLPYGSTLVKSDLVLFLKRLRDRVGYGVFRFYASGEYGDRTFRPHYHILFFNYDFPDKEFKYTTGRGDRMYTSALLDVTWGKGHAEIGSVTFDSAAYVSRYICKKITGDVAGKYYEWVDPVTGEVVDRVPEFADMSRNPGIGKPWLEKYKTDVFPRDYCVVNGVKQRVPKYYDNLFGKECELALLELKESRELYAIGHAVDNAPDRLKVREDVLLRRLKHFSRSVE